MPDLNLNIEDDREIDHETVLSPLLRPPPAVWSAAAAAAEDIDLFVQPPGERDGLPNVLIVLDNTANWNDPFTDEMAALDRYVQWPAVNERRHRQVPGRPDALHRDRASPTSKSTAATSVRRSATSTRRTRPSTQRWSTASTRMRTSRTAARPARPWPRPTSTSPASRRYTGNEQGQDRLHGQRLRHRRQSQGDLCAAQQRARRFNGSPYNSPLVNGSCARQLHHLHQQRPGAGQQRRQHHRDDLADDRRPRPPASPARRPDPDLADRLAVERGRRMGAVHEEEPARASRPTPSTSSKITGQTAGLDRAAEEHGERQRRQVLRRQLGHRRRRDRARARRDLLRDPGRQQRVRVGQLARQRQHRRHVPEPGLHRHVPARPGRRCRAGTAT